MKSSLNRRVPGSIAFGLIMIALGAFYLAIEVSPSVRAFAYGSSTWPYQILGLGAVLAVVGLVTFKPGLFIPASIVGGVGGILYYCNLTGNWEAWSYLWTLIPGFVGVGLLLLGLFIRSRGVIFGGLWTLVSSAILFGIFGFAFGDDLSLARFVWPVGLILLGLMFFIMPLFRRGGKDGRPANNSEN